MSGGSEAVFGVGGDAATFAAIEAVYRARFAEFVRVAAAICGDVDAGADAVKEAFSAALCAADDYRGEGPLDGWLWRSVVNSARNHRRGVHRRLRRQSQPAGEPHSTAQAAQGDPAVRRLVAALPERQRLVVFLRYFGGLGYAEIAAALAIAPGTVGATLNQAHAALRTAIEEEKEAMSAPGPVSLDPPAGDAPEVAHLLDRHTPPVVRSADWTDVVRRSSRRGATRRMPAALAGVTVAALAGVLVVLLVVAPGSDRPVVPSGVRTVASPDVGVVAGPVRLEAGRMSIAIPAGWTGRSRLGGDIGNLPVIQAGSFPLPAQDDDLGSAAQVGLGADDVHINLTDYGSGSASGLDFVPGPPHITRDTIGSYSGGVAKGFARTHTGVDGHNIVVDVAFGRAQPSDDQLRRANAILATFAAVPGRGADRGDSELPDGRHFGYIRSLTRRGGERYLAFDPARFLTGDEATVAARIDGAVGANDRPPGDYYIRNADTGMVVLVVGPAVEVTRLQCRRGCREGLPGDVDGLAASFGAEDRSNLATSYRGSRSQYWITIAGGTLTRIDEKYLP